MANNITFSTEDIGSGVQLGRTKIVLGTNGVDSGDVSTSNPIPVNGTVTTSPTGTQAIAGTVTAVQSGTYTTSPTGTQTVAGTITASAGTGTFTVNGSGVTQPISVVSLPLPSGAATSVKQPALGTAGTASADVITVQGISGMTALKVDNSGVTQPISGTITANAGSGTFTVDGSGVTQPVSGTVIANAGSGTFVVSVSNSPTVTANAGTGVFRVDPTGNTTQPVNVTNTLTAGVGGLGASGSAVSGNPVLVAGSDGANAHTLSTDTSGNLKISNSSKVTIANVASQTLTTGTNNYTGNSSSYNVDGFKYICFGVYISGGTYITSGPAPSGQFIIQMQGPDGNWYDFPTQSSVSVIETGAGGHFIAQAGTINIAPGVAPNNNQGLGVFTNTIKVQWNLFYVTTITFNYWLVGQA